MSECPPPAAQAQVDWAHFPGLLLGDEVVDLVALHMVLSWSRREAIVWSRSRDALAWQSCHTGCFARLGGVPAAVRVAPSWEIRMRNQAVPIRAHRPPASTAQ